MSMRMPPQVAQQQALPDLNRTSLVFFGGLVLIVLNLFWVNGNAVFSSIFRKGTAVQPIVGLVDQGWQLLGLALLTLLTEYGGEGAGSVALTFVGALWLLWLVGHLGTTPGGAAPKPTPVLGAVPGASLLPGVTGVPRPAATGATGAVSGAAQVKQ